MIFFGRIWQNRRDEPSILAVMAENWRSSWEFGPPKKPTDKLIGKPTAVKIVTMKNRTKIKRLPNKVMCDSKHKIKLKWFLIKSNKQISIKEVVSKGWFLSQDLKNFRTPPSWSSTPFLSLRGEAQWKLDPIWTQCCVRQLSYHKSAIYTLNPMKSPFL